MKQPTALVLGIANEHSIAWGCAKALRAAGFDLAITYLNDKARRFVEPLAESVGASLFLPCDVTQEGALESVFAAVSKQWGRLDAALHSIAFAPAHDLHGRVTDSSREGFLGAMDISCHSFIRMAKLAEPLMTEGGSLLTVSYYGSEKVVPHYGLMGPVKAALEASTRYLAEELGPRQIRVNAISPGPIATRAASGIEAFDALLEGAVRKAPLRRLVAIEEVGELAAFLSSAKGAAITGQVLYVDAGYGVID